MYKTYKTEALSETYTYLFFGLIVKSEIELPGIAVPEQEAQLNIAFGKTPPTLENPLGKGACFIARKNEFLLEVKGVASYYISNGNSIIIEPKENNDTDSIILFLFGSAFGALLFQRNILPLHASAFEYNNKAILLAGISGAGKSTLAAYFNSKGFPILADDISAIDLQNNVPTLNASCGNLKLWKDALLKLNIGTENLKSVRLQLEKFSYPTNFTIKSLPIGKIYLLNNRNQSGIELEIVKGIDKFAAIKENTYRRFFIKGLGIESSYFASASAVTANCRVVRVKRPNAGFELESLANAILDDLNKDKNA